jgi:hypothetical protein
MERAAPLAGQSANNALIEHGLEFQLGGSQTRQIQLPELGGSWLAHRLNDAMGWGATAPYFYRSILLRALKCKITVVLTNVYEKNVHLINMWKFYFEDVQF